MSDSHGAGSSTQAAPPAASVAQTLSAQQAGCSGLQASPRAAQVVPDGPAPPAGTQTNPANAPEQAPEQQSPAALHGAPFGTQLARHESTPSASGVQRPPQHGSGTAHGNPSAVHASESAAGRQRRAPSAPARQA